MVEWVAALISGTALLFDRIEHREDRLQQRTDLLEPLLDLYHLVREWERFAEATNSKLAAWLHASTPMERVYAQEASSVAAAIQGPRAYDIAMRTGFDVDPSNPVEHRDKLELRDLISIYAPDLEDQFRHILRLRVEQLRHLQKLANMHDPARDEEGLEEVLRAWKDFPYGQSLEIDEQILRDFERSRNQLSELRLEVASFIRTHWDPRDVTL